MQKNAWGDIRNRSGFLLEFTTAGSSGTFKSSAIVESRRSALPLNSIS